jgi:hypothetical protein
MLGPPLDPSFEASFLLLNPENHSIVPALFSLLPFVRHQIISTVNLWPPLYPIPIVN